MALELSTFLLYMTQQENANFEIIGHHTKDFDAPNVLITNLFGIMS
jgi:hypothetical protein